MNAFSPEKRTSIEDCMVEEGFSMLKEGGLRNIRIDEIARKCGIAKGSFYSFFDTKAAFIYRIMVAKREEAKRKLQDHLQNGKLSFDGLYQYLLWLARSDLDMSVRPMLYFTVFLPSFSSLIHFLCLCA